MEEAEIDYDEDQGHEDTDVPEEPHDVIDLDAEDQNKQKEKTEDEKFYDWTQRPWNVHGFDRDLREVYETMFCAVEMKPLNGSWDATEDYQREKDKEMLRYIEDFPLGTWVIPREQANQAYFRLLERTRWRNLGIRIYGQQRIPEMIPNSTPFRQGNGQMMPPPQVPIGLHPGQYPQHPRQPSVGGPGGSRPPSTGQQQGPHGPPTPQGPPNHMHPPPGQQMLPSQPNAVPMNVPPGPNPQQQMMQAPPNGPMPPPGMPPLSHMPHGLPYNVPPHMMSHANVPMQTPRPMPGAPFGMAQPPPGMQHAPVPQPAGTTPQRKPRQKKETPKPDTPPPPPPTPPYPNRERPIPRKEFNKSGKKNMRKQAEAEDFPWHRKLDFYKERGEAKWDDSGYDPAVLDAMAAVREKNMPIITRLDEELSEKQRKQRRLSYTQRCLE